MKSIYKRLPSALRAVLPWFIICICFLILSGCLWIPTFEHQEDYDMHKDFRPLVGDAKSQRPIRPRVISRQQVLAMLGPPQYPSDDGHTVAYVIRTVQSAWVHPLCFFDPETASGTIYALRLAFDSHDNLVDWQIKKKSDFLTPHFDLDLITYSNNVSYFSGEDELIEEFDALGPPLFPVKESSTQPTTRGL